MDEAWAAIIAGIIAAAAGGIGLVMTKENKTSEFRQAWIQELRAVLTEYSSTLMFIYNQKKEGKDVDESETRRVNMLLSEIHLRTNYGNQSKEEKKLDNAITKLQDSALNLIGDFHVSQEQFTDASFSVLKKEWKRVKKGEAIYRVCMWPCLLITWCGIAALVIYVFKHYEALWQFLTV